MKSEVGMTTALRTRPSGMPKRKTRFSRQLNQARSNENYQVERSSGRTVDSDNRRCFVQTGISKLIRR